MEVNVSHGTFGWNELMSSNIEASKAFYTKVAGWTYQDMPFGGMTYTLAFVEGNPVPVAGMMPCAADQPGANDWFAYINVDDIDAAVAAAVEAGGMVMREPFEIESTGWIAIVIDSAKTAIGFLEPEPMN
jgi:predicted enzyme related to lactoylglutathione lyase